MAYQGKKDSNQLLYSISQVNALTGVGTPTIRKWESAFRDYLKVVRTRGGQRRFDQDAVDKIETLKRLIYEEGLSLEGARKRLEVLQQKDAPQVEENDPTFEKLADMVSDMLVKKLFQEGLSPPQDFGQPLKQSNPGVTRADVD